MLVMPPRARFTVRCCVRGSLRLAPPSRLRPQQRVELIADLEDRGTSSRRARPTASVLSEQLRWVTRAHEGGSQIRASGSRRERESQVEPPSRLYQTTSRCSVDQTVTPASPRRKRSSARPRPARLSLVQRSHLVRSGAGSRIAATKQQRDQRSRPSGGVLDFAPTRKRDRVG